jgi:hypothetical protein
MATFAGVNVEKFVAGLHEYLAQELRPLTARLKALEQGDGKTLADFYRGVFQDGVEYSRGDLVTRSGSLWLAFEPTKECPGRSSSWRMIVKGGTETLR